MASDVLPDLLRNQVAAGPDRPAVVHADGVLTFRELAESSRRLAGTLRSVGVSADEPVGVYFEPTADLAIAVWGVLTAGGAYLPLAPDYPDERIRYMIADSGVRVVLTSIALRHRIAGIVPAGVTVLAVQDTGPAEVDIPGPAAGDLAYVIYTSGSTGAPKGVAIEHRSIVSQLGWLRRTQHLDHTAVVLQKTPISFDAAQWEVLAPACGSTIVLGGPGLHRDPEALIEAVLRFGVTTLQCVPTFLRALVDSEQLGRCTSLTQLFSGGETLSKRLARDVLAALPHVRLVNLYGPTETTINCAAHVVEPDALDGGPDSVPVGVAADDTSLHVLDAQRRPVAPGETGEVYVGGVQLARGYLHRPELTAEKFVDVDGERCYRTGDLAYRNPDGTVQFVGRADNQVKLRGFRIELDEVRLAVEAHAWVRNAAVLVKRDEHTGFENLLACVELNPAEAALMDQGSAGTHHRSKESRLQVRAQLSRAGTRDEADLTARPAIDLPGAEPTARLRRRVFARKTYRFYDGRNVTLADLRRTFDRPAPRADSRDPADLDLADLGAVLRHLGPVESEDRLLPKYGYASPGSLYATQVYVELAGIAGCPPGIYYHDHWDHRLVRVADATTVDGPRARLHLVGRTAAIEPVYRHNIREVLQLEAGHLIGWLEDVLPEFGLGVRLVTDPAPVLARLGAAADDHLLGSADLVAFADRQPPPEVDVYLQAHPDGVTDLPAGQYRYRHGAVDRISAELVRRRDVIAINQQVYDRAAVGVTFRAPGRTWADYVDLGRALHRAQGNDAGLGFMSSGYSSETGNDLPSALRIDAILGAEGASYFAVGGGISAAQIADEGMGEDIVHMRGPAEMIRDDLLDQLPHYLVPNKVVVFDALPLTANGKVDLVALRASEATDVGRADRPFVAPRTATERRIASIWRRVLRHETASVDDNFFESGGNSLLAVALINKINRALARALPLQVLFDAPTIDQLARRVDAARYTPASRLVRLRPGTGTPMFCWPGLGGYPMNLRLLADGVADGHSFHGIQALGINPGEEPAESLAEMAARDVELIRTLQPTGPYTLWGYSFGAKVAFEVAHQLERAGEQVADVFLVAPGSPRLPAPDGVGDLPVGAADFANPAFVTTLFSVFARTVTGPVLADCLRASTDVESFTAFLVERFAALEPEVVRRVVAVVLRTYRFGFTAEDLAERRLAAPVTVVEASGDGPVFLAAGYPGAPPSVVRLRTGHYDLLTASGVDELADALRRSRRPIEKEPVVPHVNIKHFPADLTVEQRSVLVNTLTDALRSAFGCEEGAVSIALEPVPKEAWNDRVYGPEIVDRRELLCKTPNY